MDIFPKNSQEYGAGDCNLIFAIVEDSREAGGGFHHNVQMVVLTPEGDFKSGRVTQRVESYYSLWEFGDAKFGGASDLEVVRFGPQLVKDLFQQLDDELHGEEDPQKIVKGINFLYDNSEFYKGTLATSYQALVEMGENDPTLTNTDIHDLGISNEDKITLEQKKAAINLLMNKDSSKKEMVGIASNMRVGLVSRKFVQIIREIVNAKIFPSVGANEAEVVWARTDLSKIYSQGKHRNLFWKVSSEGQVLEEGPGEDVLNGCAEHLLKQAPEILGWLIDQSVKSFFPKIKTQ